MLHLWCLKKLPTVCRQLTRFRNRALELPINLRHKTSSSTSTPLLTQSTHSDCLTYYYAWSSIHPCASSLWIFCRTGHRLSGWLINHPSDWPWVLKVSGFCPLLPAPLTFHLWCNFSELPMHGYLSILYRLLWHKSLYHENSAQARATTVGLFSWFILLLHIT